jgi:hypothetical protein
LHKEQKNGLASFSQAERNVYVVQGMNREVNNGGFEQFFSNSSGELAFDLVPALKAIGSQGILSVAERALQRFGTPSSLSYDAWQSHLAAITRDGKESLWVDLDREFYDTSEDTAKLLLDYVERNVAQFVP